MTRFLPLALILLLGGCGTAHAPLTVPPGARAVLAQADWRTAQRIDVGLESFDFQPDTLRLKKGRPYVLRLTNLASGGHNFDAPAFFATVALADGTAERKLGANGGVIEVEAGRTMEVRLIPLKAGTYPLICSHTLHESFGMHGKIIVQ